MYPATALVDTVRSCAAYRAVPGVALPKGTLIVVLVTSVLVELNAVWPLATPAMVKLKVGEILTVTAIFSIVPTFTLAVSMVPLASFSSICTVQVSAVPLVAVLVGFKSLLVLPIVIVMAVEAAIDEENGIDIVPALAVIVGVPAVKPLAEISPLARELKSNPVLSGTPSFWFDPATGNVTRKLPLATAERVVKVRVWIAVESKYTALLFVCEFAAAVVVAICVESVTLATVKVSAVPCAKYNASPSRIVVVLERVMAVLPAETAAPKVRETLGLEAESVSLVLVKFPTAPASLAG